MSKKFLAITLSILFFAVSAQEVPQLETYSLKNGLKIYLLQYGKIPAVNARFIINTGKKNETPGQQGYSEITASLLLQGNTKYSVEAQNDMAFKLGGELNSSSNFDNTTINANFLTKDFDAGMDLFSSAILHPLFDKDKLDQSISYLVDYNNPAKMDISDLTGMFSNLNIFGTTSPLGRHYYKTQLQLITPEKLKEFHQFNFTPKNSSVVVCGNFNAVEIKAVLEKYFGSWQSTYSEVNGVALDAPVIKKKEIAFINRTGATQCALQWNKTALSSKDKDNIAFRVANSIFSRVLFSEIREKGGKTYGIGSSYQPTQFSNLFVINCSVRSEEMANTITLFDKTLQDFNNSIVSQEDFDKAVSNMRIAIISSEVPESILSFYNPVVYDFQKRKNFLNDLAALKIEDVQKVIKKYFTGDAYKLVIAGDENVLASQLTTLKGLLKYKPADIEKDN
ncbi:MAG TPA: pitrilysin family protein [Bacteroidia bacterium]|nr:pitrilysin family protein [Bacteroidia bacterium]